MDDAGVKFEELKLDLPIAQKERKIVFVEGVEPSSLREKSSGKKIRSKDSVLPRALLFHRHKADEISSQLEELFQSEAIQEGICLRSPVVFRGRIDSPVAIRSLSRIVRGQVSMLDLSRVLSPGCTVTFTFNFQNPVSESTSLFMGELVEGEENGKNT